MLLFSYFSEGAHAPIVPVLSLSTVSPPHLALGAPAAGPGRPQAGERQTCGRAAPAGSAERRLRSGHSRSGRAGAEQQRAALSCHCSHRPLPTGEGNGKGKEGKDRHRCSRHLPAPPLPRLPSVNKGWRERSVRAGSRRRLGVTLGQEPGSRAPQPRSCSGQPLWEMSTCFVRTWSGWESGSTNFVPPSSSAEAVWVCRTKQIHN
ncbi:uncharacterized protein LOC141730434 [Zonotrichia albicollis]|uniref:uncharacterized protein LOC141730434 n=1 Tax=Zonotrichia albicollis TaxID=44394 RepID=UPI0003941179